MWQPRKLLDASLPFKFTVAGALIRRDELFCAAAQCLDLHYLTQQTRCPLTDEVMGKTVVVVGAGASTEFSYSDAQSMPVGEQLAVSIREVIAAEIRNYRSEGDCPLIDVLSHEGFGGEHLSAMHRIRDGIVGTESIDQFIDEYGDVTKLPEVARVAIAYCLLSAESGTSMGPPRLDPRDASRTMADLRSSWLGYMLRFHRSNVKRRRDLLSELDDIEFITFNYDRTIEQYLWLHLTRTIGINANEARSCIERIKIVHVYGQMGQLPELGGKIPFGDFSPWSVLSASKEIRTFSESVDSARARLIADAMASADRHIYLGMAFHPQNMQILFPEGRPREGARGFATVLGLRNRRLGEVEALYSSVGGQLRWDRLTAAQLLSSLHDELFD